MAGREDMIAWAEKSLGLGEPNYIQAWYESRHGDLGSNWPWCGAAVSYWGNKSGNGRAVGEFAYTVAHAEWFRSQGRWHSDVAGISRGDIIFFDWGFSNSISAIDHVGLVTGTASGGAVLTIEGNTANRCARRVRYASTIAGYGRPAYAGASPPPPPPPNGKYEPYPGADFFTDGRSSPIIGRMHARLVAEACNRYQTGVNRNVWGSGDRASYKAWQGKNGFTGADANGIPGRVSWDRLKVPKG
jgi:hypothetical protein